MVRLLLVILVLSCTAVAAERDLSAPSPCSKTVSFAIAEGGQPIPALPKFVIKWISNKKHDTSYKGLCLSQVPAPETANYVIVFAIDESSFEGLLPTAQTYTSSDPRSDGASSARSSGGMWNYAYSATLPSRVTGILDLQHVDVSKKALILRGYDQHGKQILHYSMTPGVSREKLLEQSLLEIQRVPLAASKSKKVVAPLSVYYVNCDVDSAPVSLPREAPGRAARTADPQPSPTEPATRARLEIASQPPAVDTYLDNRWIGKTPLVIEVSPGEHVLTMSKTEFSTWGRTLHLTEGTHRVKAYLDHKVLNLPALVVGGGAGR